MLRAIKDRVIIERSEEQRVTAMGIVLKRDISEQVYGCILDIGPEVQEELNVGNRVVVDWRTTSAMPYQGRTLYTVKASDILAVVEE